MKLYVFPPSPRARKPMAVAFHLGLQVEMVFVNLLAGEQKKPEFLKLNPNGRMPVLEDGDFLLWESEAIMQYLAEQKPGPLYPAGARVRADIARWQFWDVAHWDAACAILLFENMIKGMVGGGGPDPARIREGEEKFIPLAKVLDQHLSTRQWLVGDGLTIADFAIAAPLHYAQMCRLPVQEFAAIRAWYERIEQFDAWKKSAPPPLG